MIIMFIYISYKMYNTLVKKNICPIDRYIAN